MGRSIVSSAQRGGMSGSRICLSRVARASPLCTHRYATANAGATLNQQKSFFSFSKPSGSPRPLHHIHIPYIPFPAEGKDPSIWTYAQVDSLQQHLRRRLLDYKAASGSAEEPNPFLITFTSHPVFTYGLRQHEATTEVPDYLRMPFRLRFTDNASSIKRRRSLIPAVTASPRGGLETYHGPGQLVFWPIIDLRSAQLRPGSSRHSPLGVRTWATLLEDITGDLLRERYGINGVTESANPGIWMKDPVPIEEEGETQHPLISRELCPERIETPRKIAALGVHLRRYVTGLGISINLSTPQEFVLGGTLHPTIGSLYGSQRILLRKEPWTRIDACGVPDRLVTSVVAERIWNRIKGLQIDYSDKVDKLKAGLGSVAEAEEIEAAAADWAGRLASALGLENGVQTCSPLDVGFEPTPLEKSITKQYSKKKSINNTEKKEDADEE